MVKLHPVAHRLSASPKKEDQHLNHPVREACRSHGKGKRQSPQTSLPVVVVVDLPTIVSQTTLVVPKPLTLAGLAQLRSLLRRHRHRRHSHQSRPASLPRV